MHAQFRQTSNKASQESVRMAAQISRESWIGGFGAQ